LATARSHGLATETEKENTNVKLSDNSLYASKTIIMTKSKIITVQKLTPVMMKATEHQKSSLADKLPFTKSCRFTDI
jgi:hypothetical protein